eukprot:TRINITY_DN1241_c0_g4_i1.p1 TRINITY_DN1241_c0_g4~~TRINITY_DN1241_c0_g4_i1.p1  ORF type:complete len:765 (-),score=97.87 TRINITY_DN1241_c0_g4_i1:146-2440(-)
MRSPALLLATVLAAIRSSSVRMGHTKESFDWFSKIVGVESAALQRTIGHLFLASYWAEEFIGEKHFPEWRGQSLGNFGKKAEQKLWKEIGITSNSEGKKKMKEFADVSVLDAYIPDHTVDSDFPLLSKQGRAVALKLNHLKHAPVLISILGSGRDLSDNCLDLVGSAQARFDLPEAYWGAEVGCARFALQEMLSNSERILALRPGSQTKLTLLSQPPSDSDMERMTPATVKAVVEHCKLLQEEYKVLPTAAKLETELQTFVKHVATEHPGTPVLLVGHSAGGNLAMEVACALQAKFDGVLVGLGVAGEGHHSKCVRSYQLVHAFDGPRRLVLPEVNAPIVMTPSEDQVKALATGEEGCGCKSLDGVCRLSFEAWAAYGTSHQRGCCMHQTHQGYALSKLITSTDTSFAYTRKQLCSAPLPRNHSERRETESATSSTLLQLQGSKFSLRTKREVLNYLYGSEGLPRDGIKLADSHARGAAAATIMKKMSTVESILSLDALEEVLNAAVAFGIIATVYDDKAHQELARLVVDKSVELYAGDDWKDKVPVDRDFGPFNLKMGTKQLAYGELNHFFTIYLMTWLPGKRGLVHTHGESACSFKFLSATPGAANLNFKLKGEGTSLTRAFLDGAKHHGYTEDPDKYHAALDSLRPFERVEAESLLGKKVAYIQDDIGAHRIDNDGTAPVHSIHVYYPAYEAAWVFTNWDDDGNARQFKNSTRIEVWTYKKFKEDHPEIPDPMAFLPGGGGDEVESGPVDPADILEAPSRA